MCEAVHSMTLMCGFQVTKQERRAHVILSTSEYAFVSWLRKGERLCDVRVRLCDGRRSVGARQ
jgi:hypothetical protein